MSVRSIEAPYDFFHDDDGNALEAGYIYIGVKDLDPVTNPITVYWDAALTTPASQPVRTVAGYASNNGTIAQLYVGSDYSIEVQNKNAAVVYEASSQVGRVSADMVSYNQGGTGAVNRTAEQKFQESVSVKDFGAVGDGVTDDTAAIQAAIDANKAIFFPPSDEN